ncbi:MAG: hypothetical protein ABI321_13050 [Polyangia bacterium]
MRRFVATVFTSGALLSGMVGGALARPHKKPKPKPAPVAAPAPVATPAPEQEAAVPAPAPAPPTMAETPPPKPTRSTVDVDALVTEYSAIRDELFRSRAKTAVIGEALLKTKLEVTFKYEAGRAWPLRKVTLRLDDRPVYAAESVNGTDAQKVFETVAAAGQHVITARVEAVGTGEDRITYTTESSFGIDLADGKLTRVELAVDETGSGPASLAKKHEGSFDVRWKANVKSQKQDSK